MISYHTALQQVLATVAPLTPTEVSLDQALGQVLAVPAAARWDMPRWDNSAMDGFALGSGDEPGGNWVQVVGAVYAGQPFATEVTKGQAVRITTGAPLPPGADRVIPVEQVEDHGQRIRLQRAVEPGRHVRRRGSEFRRDEQLVAAGTRLQAGEIALLASAGIARVAVYPSPRVAIISTGDELVELGCEPGPGQIVNSSLHLLSGRLTECGCRPVPLGIGPDDPQRLADLIGRARDADLVISTGGVSVGDKDHVPAALARLNFRTVFRRVAIKPGKPLLFGLLDERPYFGLPGNPAASGATFELFVRPALLRLAGHTEVRPKTVCATLTAGVKVPGDRQAFLWGQLACGGGGWQVTPARHQCSGQTRGLAQATGLIVVPCGLTEVAAGEAVEVMPLPFPCG